MIPKHVVAPHEVERIKPIIAVQVLDHKAQSATPVGILLGGQPASGKTGLIRLLQRQNQDKTFIIINGDALRAYHPRSEAILFYYGLDAPKYTQPFSNSLVEWLKAECIRLRYNFIIEGTMRTLSVIKQTTQTIRQAGFICEGHVLAVARDDSLLGVFQRFEEDLRKTGLGRFSPVFVHDEAYRQIPDNLNVAVREQWFDRLVIHTRVGGRQLMAFHTIENSLMNSPIDMQEVFTKARRLLFENSYYHQQWQAIAHLARQRGETNADYLGQIDGFIRQFAIDILLSE